LELSSLNTSGKDEKTREENLVLRQNLAVMGIVFMAASVATADDVGGSEIPVPSSAASTVVEEDWVRAAPYVAIAGVFGVEEMGSNLARDTNAKNGGGLNVRGGYRMGRYASVEIEGEWIREFGSGLQNPWLLTANLRVYYPFGPHGMIQPYLTGGAGVFVPKVHGENEVTGAYRVGAGIDFYITKNWSIGPAAEWVSTTSGDPAMRYVSCQFGVQYTF
jgi:opacity protein-like surface antigen